MSAFSSHSTEEDTVWDTVLLQFMASDDVHSLGRRATWFEGTVTKMQAS